MIEFFVDLIKGLGLNFIITVMAIIVPLILGVAGSLLVKNQKTLGKVFWYLDIPCRSVCVPVALVLMYYLPGLAGTTILRDIDILMFEKLSIDGFSKTMILILILGFAFLWYMPAKYNHEFSLAKNILYNGMGLFSNVFKWSFVAGMIVIPDMLKITQIYVAKTYSFLPYIIPFLVVSFILFVIELVRVLIKHFMK